MTTPQWLVAWAGDERSSVLEVTAAGAAATAVAALVPRLVDDGVAGGIARQDGSLWGVAAAAAGAGTRLGWVDLAEAARDLVEEILELREDLRAEGVNRVVLCGSGDVVPGPDAIARTAGVPLLVLDGIDPDRVRQGLAGDCADGLTRTVVVLSGTAGAAVGTDARRRAVEAAFAAAGIDPARRIVAVTSSGSPLQATAEAAGYRRVFPVAPHLLGRFSALSAFGLVPAGLAGADLNALLDDASAVSDLLAEDAEGNPALVLGAAIAGTDPLRDKLMIADEGSGLVGFCDWAEQLIAESLGAAGGGGAGLVPVVVEGPDASEVANPPDDALVVRLVAAIDEDDDPFDRLDADAPFEPAANAGHGVTVAGPLGSQLMLWEYAVAVAGRILEIDPFHHPDVGPTERASHTVLGAGTEQTPPDLVDGAVEIRATAGLLGAATDLDGALAALIGRLGPGGWTTVTAHLDRDRDAALAGVRRALSARSHRPVTFGWAPRARHVAAAPRQGDPATGVHLQITGVPDADLEIPGLPFTFGSLSAARAAGDAHALADLGRPVLRLHLTDRRAGLAQLAAVLGVPALTGAPSGGGAGPHGTEGASA